MVAVVVEVAVVVVTLVAVDVRLAPGPATL
jgi:hypothetical protein